MTDRTLIVEYKNKQPLELGQLAASLAALGDQFKRFVADKGGVDADARLFVHEMRPGSTIAELIALGKVVGDLYEVREQLAGFVPVLNDMMRMILNLSPKASDLDRPTIKNISNIVAPIAIDPGAQLNVIDNTNGVINNTFVIGPPDAAAIVHNAQHLLNSQFPAEERFSNEPLTLFQMRDAPPGRSGDYGTIDRFSPRPHKLTFASEAVKNAVLHSDGNPFELVFWVDGVVKTAGGTVAGFLIHVLTDTTPRAF